jgi:hypothetical protein
MSALLRYAFLKSWRDRSLIAFTLFTGTSLLCGRLAVALAEVIRGVQIGFAPNDELVTISVAGSTAMASLSGFWILRLEIRDRSVGSMLLATRPLLIAVTVMIYSGLIGLTSFLITVPALGLRVPSEVGTFGNLLLIAVCSFAVAGAFGFTTAAISPEPPMVIPTWIGSAFIFASLFHLTSAAPVFGAALAAGGMLILTTTFLLERRCAA